MCSIDWNAVAAWVTAIATVGLLIVAVKAAIYAKGAADSALEALQLEAEPVLMASVVDPAPLAKNIEIANNGSGAIRYDLSNRVPNRTPNTLYVAITNFGRSPAMNVQVRIKATIQGTSVAEALPVYIQGLEAEGRIVMKLDNTSGMPVTFEVLNDATRISGSGKVVPVRLFTSTAIPITF